MDAIKLLKADHDEMQDMLTKLDETGDRAVKTREQMFKKVFVSLRAHETIEEEILYPILKERREAEDIVLEAYEEHHVADLIVSELANLPADDETWGAKLTVLKENLEHHIGEEEGEMFKLTRKLIDSLELEEIGARMELRKAEVIAEVTAQLKAA